MRTLAVSIALLLFAAMLVPAVDPTGDLACASVLLLSGSVGLGGMNLRWDVISVQAQLRQLGFSWIKVDGVCGPITIGAIRLFQSICMGRQTVGGDGRVDRDQFTHRWLKAENAPRWQLLSESGPGFVNIERLQTKDHHDNGTSWLEQTIRGAAVTYHDEYAEANYGSPVTLNDASPPRGGDTPDHGGHECGLSVDMRLPVKGGAVPKGDRTWESRDYDRSAMRAQLEAFREQALTGQVFFNDPVLISEGLCKCVTGHDYHCHVQIEPPIRAASS